MVALGTFGNKSIGEHFNTAQIFNSVSIGTFSHAEGDGTLATGDLSHAEGFLTEALGQGSHAEGIATIASGSYQHVSGQYNAQNDDVSYFIVGCGTSDVDRKDAFKVTINAAIAIPQTQSSAPGWTGIDGEIVPASIAGSHYLYMWMAGSWRSSSFA